jgi:hypothetical protein
MLEYIRRILLLGYGCHIHTPVANDFIASLIRIISDTSHQAGA